jgi:NADH-quinone oxidoreductase subunit J
MLTRRLMQSTESPFNGQWGSGIVAAAFSLAGLVYLILEAWPDSANADVAPVSAEILQGGVAQLGVFLVSPNAFVVPFEVASVLLLAALIGSIYIALPEKNES